MFILGLLFSSVLFSFFYYILNNLFFFGFVQIFYNGKCEDNCLNKKWIYFKVFFFWIKGRVKKKRKKIYWKIKLFGLWNESEK